MVGSQTSLAELLVTLLITIAVVAGLVRVVRIPYTVGLVLAGVVLAFLPNTPEVMLTPSVILTIFLPILLFYGAYHLDVTELRANLAPIALLAVPGVVATAGLVGVALHLAAGLDWTSALLFGTIVAATDPVAVLTIFGEMGAPRRLSVIVTGESLFNDGTALVFFATVLGVAATHTVDVGATAEQLAVAVVGALVLGGAVGVLGTAVLRHVDDALVETIITLIVAYGGYLLADRLGASGPMETVAAGIVLGVGGRTAMSATTRLQSGATWEFLDFLANSLLFLLVGMEIRAFAPGLLGELETSLWQSLVAAIVAVTVVRALVVTVVGWVLRSIKQQLPHGWSTVLAWSGLRGAVAVAAALSLPTSLPQRNLLLTLTFGVVLFTIVIQGLTIRPVLAIFGLVGRDTGEHTLQVALGRLHALNAATDSVEALREAGAISDQSAAHLSAQFQQQRVGVQAQLDQAYANDPTFGEEQERMAYEHLIHVQHEAARDAYARGVLSAGALRELLAQIDAQGNDAPTPAKTPARLPDRTE